MTVQRMHHVGVVVQDLDAATAIVRERGFDQMGTLQEAATGASAPSAARRA